MRFDLYNLEDTEVVLMIQSLPNGELKNNLRDQVRAQENFSKIVRNMEKNLMFLNQYKTGKRYAILELMGSNFKNTLLSVRDKSTHEKTYVNGEDLHNYYVSIY